MALMRKKPDEGAPEDGGTAGGEPAGETPRGSEPAEQPRQASSEPAKESGTSSRPTGSGEAEGATKSGEATKVEDAKKSEDARARKKRERGERAAERRGEVVAKTRSRVAQLVWLLFVVAALFLAVGALCVALGANKGNGAVQFILDGAKFFDLGIFSRSNGIKTFGGDNAATKNALFNWGIAAVLYLVVGRIVERIIRP